MLTSLDSAVAIATRGVPVFPARDKRPLVQWKDAATCDVDQLRMWWARWPDAEVGVPMPEGTVAVDIDDLEAVRDAAARGDIAFVPTAGQQTRGGGFHFFYRTDGRVVAQVVKRGGIALDTRVGGLGYVIAYDPEAFVPDTWAKAPEWVYEREEVARPERTQGAPMSTRQEILSWLGTFPARGIALSEDAYRALLLNERAKGRIFASDPSRPWTDDDLAKLAYEASKWDVDRMLQVPTLPGEERTNDNLRGMDAADLLELELPPLRWAFEGLLPEGMVVIGAPPKAGKSLLAYQMCVHLVLGIDLLGKAAEKRPVRYYALEDGQRRSQRRILDILAGLGRPKMPKGLDLRWTSPKLGGELEAEVDAYLTTNPLGVVVIDVLAKVRPESKSKSMNAYDEDYRLLEQMHTVTTCHPGSTVVIVTHDRKAGADDWVSRITGTRGVTGVADAIIYINRKRSDMVGTIHLTGRDAEDATIEAEFTGHGWTPADKSLIIATRSPVRQQIWNWVKEHGPAWQASIIEGTGLSRDVVEQRVRDMAKDGELRGTPLGYEAE